VESPDKKEAVTIDIVDAVAGEGIGVKLISVLMAIVWH